MIPQLPTELSLMIFDEYIQQEGSRAKAAAVSRAWQARLEPTIFRRLKLTVPRLADFDKIATPRSKAIDYIWLCIELPKPPRWEECGTRPTRDDEYRDHRQACNQLIEDTLRKTLEVLSKWDDSASVTLDISIHYPCCKDLLEIGYDIRGRDDFFCDEASGERLEKYHDFKHGVVTPMTPSIVTMPCVNDDFFNGVDFWSQVPKVPAVKSLLLRRQNKLSWLPRNISKVFSCFPNLQEFVHEPNSPGSGYMAPISDECYYDVLQMRPESLKKLTIFEDRGGLGVELKQPLHKSRVMTARALASTSLTLDHLSVGLFVDASIIFKHVDPDWVWNDLQSVVLTDTQLAPGSGVFPPNIFFQSAAEVARKMPCLRKMALWNADTWFAGVFTYEAPSKTTYGRGSAKKARISWKGSWDLELQWSTIEAWKEVVLQRPAVRQEREPHDLQVTSELVRFDEDGFHIKSHSDVVRVLGLSQVVACPSSLWQIHDFCRSME